MKPLEHGDQKKIAEAIGMSVSQLCDLLNGRRRMRGETAIALEDASKGVLGRIITVREWIEMGDKARGRKIEDK